MSLTRALTSATINNIVVAPAAIVFDYSRTREHPLSQENLGEVADLAGRRRLLLGVAKESDAAKGNELSSHL